MLLSVAAHHAYEHARMSQIGSDLDTGNGDEADDSRILNRLREERRNLFADRLGDPIRATSVTQLPSTSECARPAPCGSTR
jgi:hypothetical protein